VPGTYYSSLYTLGGGFWIPPNMDRLDFYDHSLQNEYSVLNLQRWCLRRRLR
jgi:hypothetical protein